MTEQLRTRIRDALPAHWQVPAKYWYGWARHRLEPEMGVLASLAHAGDRVIDVGGNRGVYAYRLWKLGCTVEVFEPNPVCCSVLSAWIRGKQEIRLHEVALSDRQGEARLHIPVDERGVEHDASASLEHGFAGFRDETVPVTTLDSFDFDRVTLIKIDVEGHERSVLAGATRTLASCRPALLIEIEQRHNNEPIQRIFESIEAQGYSGYFLDAAAGTLRPLSEFQADRDQPNQQFGLGNARYINNFLFLHERGIAEGRYRALQLPTR